MSIPEAIEILTQYNLWRRDDHIPNAYEMPAPKEIGIAIDKAVEAMKWIIALGGDAQRWTSSDDKWAE